MMVSKLTKSQRRRANERMRKQADQDWEKRMGAMPEYLRHPELETNLYTTPPSERDPIERAPPHMVAVEQEDGSYVWNSEAIENLISGASLVRTQKKRHRIEQLKLLYPELWGQRGKARIIVAREARAGRAITIRTVQQYFKATRINK